MIGKYYEIIPYADGLDLQKTYHRKVLEGKVDDLSKKPVKMRKVEL